MGLEEQVNMPRKTPRANRTKSKAGCRTCKIRRIKCDEARPECHKCVSTGRTCDGYGVWGGGDTVCIRDSTSRHDCNIAPPHNAPFSSLAESPEEVTYFEWFKHRTTNKLPGLFASSFWDTLLLQASSTEPSVWHATLALSSVHKREAINGKCIGTILDSQEQFMLRQYSKAIGYLIQPHSSPRSRASTRVALVTCVVFIYLELLRGHYRAAQTHLENGLKLLEEIKLSGIFKPQQLGESTDGSIIEAFFRVCVQAQLLIQPSQQPLLSLRASELEIPTRFFESIDQARQHLYLLLNEIFNLNKLAKQQPTYNAVGSSLELVDHQRRIQAELASWLEIHKASRSIFLSPSTIRGTFAYELLSIYHIMATIMCHTCLSPYSSYIYDSHASSFTSMIMKSIYLQKSQSVVSEALHGHAAATDKSKAIIDMGWIPPLYYIAIKCRTHRIRLQAVKFLESTGNTHKEGIWDSSIAACVARKVMEVEERDFYRDLMVDDDFKFCNPPEEKDFLVPVLPDEYRIHDVQVVLPDDPMGKILLSYRRGQNDCSWEYDMLSECWTDTGKINEQEEMANPERDLNLREGA